MTNFVTVRWPFMNLTVKESKKNKLNMNFKQDNIRHGNKLWDMHQSRWVNFQDD